MPAYNIAPALFTELLCLIHEDQWSNYLFSLIPMQAPDQVSIACSAV